MAAKLEQLLVQLSAAAAAVTASLQEKGERFDAKSERLCVCVCKLCWYVSRSSKKTASRAAQRQEQTPRRWRPVNTCRQK